MVVSFEHGPIVADLAERTRELVAEVVQDCLVRRSWVHPLSANRHRYTVSP
jgi:hypothetical protein